MKQTTDAFPWLLAAFILNGISSISLPCLWYLFWKSRNHFIISARFPKLTLLMSMMVFLCSIAAMMNLYVLNIYDFDKEKTRSLAPSYPITLVAAITFAFLFCSFIVYRTFLIYDKWSNQERTLQNQSTIIVGGFNSENDKEIINALQISDKSHNQTSHRNLKRILIGTMITSFIFFLINAPGLIYQDLVFPQQKLLPVSFVMIIILGTYILIKARRMRESMLCKRETYMIASVVLANIIVDNLPFPSYVGFFSGVISGMYLF